MVPYGPEQQDRTKEEAQQLAASLKKNESNEYTQSEKNIMKEYNDFFDAREAGVHEKKIIGLKYTLTPDLMNDIKTIAEWDVDGDFFENTILRPDSAVPAENLAELVQAINESRDVDEFYFTGKELTDLQTVILTGSEQETKEFIEQEKTEYLTATEIFGDNPTKLESRRYQGLQEPRIWEKNNEYLQFLGSDKTAGRATILGKYAFLSSQLNQQIAEAGEKNEKITRENITRLSKENEALLKSSESTLGDILEYFSKSGQQDVYLNSYAFTNPVDSKEFWSQLYKDPDLLDSINNDLASSDQEIRTGAQETFKDLIRMQSDRESVVRNISASNDRLEKEVGDVIGKSLETYANTENRSSIDKAVGALDGLLQTVDKIGDKIQEMYAQDPEKWERLFSLPFIGPTIRSFMIPPAAEQKGGRYYEARLTYLENEGKLSGEEELLWSSYLDSDMQQWQQPETNSNLVSVSNSVKRKLTRLEAGETTLSSISHFNTDYLATQLVEGKSDTLLDQISESGDSVVGSYKELIRNGDYMPTMLASQLYTGQQLIESHIQEYTTTNEQGENVPTNKFIQDLNRYIALRLDSIVDNNVVLDYPQDIAQIVVADLIKQGDPEALKYHSLTKGNDKNSLRSIDEEKVEK